MAHLICTILPAILLLQAIYHRHIVISRTAVHQLETAVAKRLRGIGVSAQVDDDRLLLVIDDEVADVIMIMALGIVATLGSKKSVLIQ